MNEENAFLKAIWAEPADDDPRLVYADWLEEHGDVRGDFIRVQCALAKAPPGDARRVELMARARDLFRDHGSEWLQRFRGLIIGGKFRRGILDRITVPAHIFLEDKTTLLCLAPIQNIVLDLIEFTVPQAVVELIPESVARENMVLPLAQETGEILIARSDPSDTDLIQKLAFILNRDVEAVLAEPQQLIDAINRHYVETETESVDSMIQEFVDVARDFSENDPPGQGNDTEESDRPVLLLVNLIIQEAVALRATDIWIERSTNLMHVSYRIDGKWVERDSPPLRLLPRIIARFQQLASIDLARGATSGTCRMRVGSNGQPFELRVRILPAAHGQAVRVRLRPLPAPV